jgi:hypothetical protein
MMNLERPTNFIIAGLDPAIFTSVSARGDARVKPGHEDGGGTPPFGGGVRSRRT